MNIAVTVISSLLLVWFFGCIVTYRIGRYKLVDGMGVKSAECFMFVLFTSSLVTYFTVRPIGQWILFGVLLFWLTVQFFCHWYYTIFGASEKKLRGYNKCFADTVRLIPKSDTRIIPDLYHIILHLLILTDIVLVLTGAVLR